MNIIKITLKVNFINNNKMKVNKTIRIKDFNK